MRKTDYTTVVEILKFVRSIHLFRGKINTLWKAYYPFDIGLLLIRFD